MPTGRFRCDDGGIYYIREEMDGEVVWFGEDDQPGMFYDTRFTSRRFANAFRGRRNGEIIAGNFYDLPKGKAVGMGELRLQIISNDQLRRISSSGFGGTVWNRITDSAIPSADSNFSPPEFQSGRAEDLTGTWMGNDDGAYYIRHTPDNQIVWFGEHPTAQFANVFFGVRSLEPLSPLGTTLSAHIRGQWFDIPKFESGATGRGELHLQQHDHPAPLGPRLATVASSGGFGGQEWQRVDAVSVVVRLNSLTLVNNDESRDEPYLWVFFIKVDGRRINILDSHHSFISVEGKGGSGPNNLTPAENLPQGTRITLPNEVYSYRTVLRTMRGLLQDAPIARQATNLILLVVGLEEDLTNEHVVRSRYEALQRSLEEALTTEFRSAVNGPGTITDRLATAVASINRNARSRAMRAATSFNDFMSWIDRDDVIEAGIHQFSFNDLRPGLGAVPFSIDLRKLDRDDPSEVDAYYRVDGDISAA